MGVVLLFPQDGFVLECGLMDYGYGLIIDGCGCVDFWTIWIWFFFYVVNQTML